MKITAKARTKKMIMILLIKSKNPLGVIKIHPHNINFEGLIKKLFAYDRKI